MAAERKELHTKLLASLIRKLISMSLAIGPVARLMTRSMYCLLNTREAWFDVLPLTTEALAEIEFCCLEITRFNGQNIWPSPSAVRVVYTVQMPVIVDMQAIQWNMDATSPMDSGSLRKPLVVLYGGNYGQ